MDTAQTQTCEIICTVGGDIDRKILKEVRQFFRRQIHAGMAIINYVVKNTERVRGKFLRIEIAATLAPHNMETSI